MTGLVTPAHRRSRIRFARRRASAFAVLPVAALFIAMKWARHHLTPPPAGVFS